jgi:hypothetical protein
MLQDLERGRSLEIDALVTAVQEVGRLLKVATPTIDTVLALVQERGRQAGLYANDSSANPDFPSPNRATLAPQPSPAHWRRRRGQ